ncbi:MAG: NAD(P)-dependent oxidoreductase, partial [Candidatus Sericytochromatia bacterium]
SYGEHTVAEHAFALLLALARKLRVAVRQTRELDFSLSGLMGFDLKGKTLGVVGAGRIGRQVLRIGRGFGMRTIAYDPFPAPEWAETEGFLYVSLDSLLRESDVVSVHAALTPETTHLIDRAALQAMKRTAVLINTARGPIIDTEALCEAMHEGWIAGAGLDVLEGEELLKEEAELLHRPLEDRQLRQLLYGHSLLRHDNVIVTPHSAFFTREGIARLVETSLDDIRAYLAGRPANLVPGSPAPAVRE